MKSYLKRLTTKKLALVILGSVIFLAFQKPCPGDYSQLGDVEPKVRAVTTFIFWITFTGFQIKRRFFGEDLWAVRVGENLIFLFACYTISALLQFSIIRLYCLVAPTKKHQMSGSVIKAKKADKRSADYYFMTFHTNEGDYDFYTSRKETVGDSLTLHLYETSWGVVYGTRISQ
ncbi:hypothetical protein [Larkinella sp. C7]|jgi:hypothetical protein|uniref:hypothetical protein n=1 Tax=Larkinella sp. C7 TaxID=2576607 RepID=UPI0011110F4C|nr:hypothetical protein [Larkinella sp. C7]